MIPVKEYVIVNFLSWINEKYPNIPSLRILNDSELRSLCEEYFRIGHFLQIDIILKEFRNWFVERQRFEPNRFNYDSNVDLHLLLEDFHHFLHDYEHDRHDHYREFDQQENHFTIDLLYNSINEFLHGYIYQDLAEKIKHQDPQIFHFIMLSGHSSVVPFLKWLSSSHPEIDLLQNIPESILRNLISKFYESSNTYKIFGSEESETLYTEIHKLRKKGYYKDLFKELLEKNINEKRRNRNLIESVDPLERFKTVPLHAVFLFTSQHHNIQKYIAKNWGALSSMSGDYCDIYFSSDQLNYQVDAFEIMEQLKTDTDISKFPGILFWKDEISKGHFITLKDLSDKDITNLLLTVFQKIRMSASIESIEKGETLYFAENQNKSTAHSQITINVGTAYGMSLAKYKEILLKMILIPKRCKKFSIPWNLLILIGKILPF